jgi:hypothetical protein
MSIDSAIGSYCLSRLDYAGRHGYADHMTTASQVLSDLQTERRNGNVSSETQQHLKHEFRKLGRDATDATLATAIGSEIDRLEREAATLRRLRSGLSEAA